MKLDVEGHTLEVKFYPLIRSGRGTKCIIKGVPSELQATVTDVWWNHRDPYSRQRGERAAFADVLFKAFPGREGKETRRKYWQAYLEKRKPKNGRRAESKSGLSRIEALIKGLYYT